MKKSIFISHSSRDQDSAIQLATILSTIVGENEVWIDFFDLDAGANLATTIPNAIQAASWFILLASESSMKSNWVKYEASLATLLNIERENYHIVTIKLDKCKFPKELDIQLRLHKYLDASKNTELVFSELGRIIVQSTSSSNSRTTTSDPFVGRGKEQDNLEVLASKNKVVYLAGIPGIGKSSLVKKIATTRFSRNVLSIDLRRSHDIELLTRQVISLTGNPQPPPGETLDSLLETSVYLLKVKISEGYMLFLNNIQNSMNTDGTMLPFLHQFLQAYIECDPEFPLFLAGTRLTKFLPDEILKSVPVRIDGLENRFMILAIQRWYKFMNPSSPELDEDNLQDLAERLNGYPLAAKLVAGDLTFESPQNLIEEKNMLKFQQGMAEFILGRIVNELDQVDNTILYTMAIFETNISMRYLMSLSVLKSFGKENIINSLSKFSESRKLKRT